MLIKQMVAQMVMLLLKFCSKEIIIMLIFVKGHSLDSLMKAMQQLHK